MKRETELLIKGANIEITKVLRNFDEMIDSKLGDTVTITTEKEVITRKATLQDTIDFIKSEWSQTTEKLSELGIEIDNKNPIDIKENHKAIYKELEKYAVRANSNGAISYLEYKNIQIPYRDIYMEDDVTGGTALIPYMSGDVEASALTFILLDKNTEYEVIDKIGEGEQPLLVEK